MLMDGYKQIEGYSKYYISKNGEVFSKISNKILKYHLNTKNGYYMIVLVSDSGVKKTLYIHRLVASAYCEKLDGCDFVNHKNEIKTDCRADNLEWCTKYYNNTYNNKVKRSCKKIISTDESTGEEIIWESARVAAKALGVSYKNISAVCRGLRPRCAGLKWRFANG